MGFDLIKEEFLIDPDETRRHGGYYTINAGLVETKRNRQQHPILFFVYCAPKDSKGPFLVDDAVGSDLFIPHK